jgi:hypothetical protein
MGLTTIGRWFEHAIHRLSCLTSGAFEQVPVSIEHHAGARVTVALGHQDGVRTLFDEERIRRVPERVEGDVREPSLAQQRFEIAANKVAFPKRVA